MYHLFPDGLADVAGVLDIVMLGAAHEACRRLLAGADLDPEWLRTQLPSAAWRAISRRPRAG